MNLFLDIGTGEFRKTLNGAALPAVKFYAGDVVTLAITLVDGQASVTATQLSGGKRLRAAIRVFPLSSEPLATATLSSVSGQVVSGSLDLSAQAITNFFAANVPDSSPSSSAILEVQIEASDLSTVETISQARSLIARDLVTIGIVQADFNADDFSSTDFKTTTT